MTREELETAIAAIVGAVVLVAGLWLLMVLGKLPDMPKAEPTELTRDEFGRKRDLEDQGRDSAGQRPE